MHYFSKKTIQSLFKQHKVFPKKRLGQNFLIDKKILRKIIKAAGIGPTAIGESRPSGRKDIILEIGPGIGNLTQELARNTKHVIAIEKDIKMVEILKEATKNLKNVKIIQGDILKISNSQFLISKSYKVVANLPYYIVSPVIRKFLEMKNPPKLMVLMVQKEVAQRICAKPPEMTLLSVSVQFYAKPEIISLVSKKSFWPQPKVDSAIIKITPRKLSTSPGLVKLFFKIVRAGFSQPRKQIANNLSRVLKIKRGKAENWLTKNKIRPTRRAETLSVRDWTNLTKTFPSINNYLLSIASFML